MGLGYLWDTNTVIYYLQNQLSQHAKEYLNDVLKQSIPAISVITEIELLSWNAPSEKDLEVIEEYIDETRILGLEPEIRRKTAEIRRSAKIRLPDAIIASTAIVNDLILLTRNTKDFSRIESLKMADPFYKDPGRS